MDFGFSFDKTFNSDVILKGYITLFVVPWDWNEYIDNIYNMSAVSNLALENCPSFWNLYKTESNTICLVFLLHPVLERVCDTKTLRISHLIGNNLDTILLCLDLSL